MQENQALSAELNTKLSNISLKVQEFFSVLTKDYEVNQTSVPIIGFNKNIYPARALFEKFTFLFKKDKDEREALKNSLISDLSSLQDLSPPILKNYLTIFLQQSFHFCYSSESKQTYEFIYTVLIEVAVKKGLNFSDVLEEFEAFKNFPLEQPLEQPIKTEKYRLMRQKELLDTVLKNLNIQKNNHHNHPVHSTEKVKSFSKKTSPKNDKELELFDFSDSESEESTFNHNSLDPLGLETKITTVQTQINNIESKLESRFVFKREILREKKEALKMLLIRFQVTQQQLFIKFPSADYSLINAEAELKNLNLLIDFWKEHYQPVIEKHRYPKFLRLFSELSHQNKTNTFEKIQDVLDLSHLTYTKILN